MHCTVDVTFIWTRGTLKWLTRLGLEPSEVQQMQQDGDGDPDRATPQPGGPDHVGTDAPALAELS